jgi:hypothetical protein
VCSWEIDGQIANLVKLTREQQEFQASCLDGSPPAFYIIPGTGDGLNKWFLHFMGGGYCASLADCYGRSLTFLGSSSEYPETLDLGGGYFSDDPNVNPLMYNWNKVFFAYCDGSCYTGNNANVINYDGHSLYFRGFRNVQAYFSNLATNYPLLKGTDFVIGGCSAGGVATYFNIDWWRLHLPQSSTVKGLPDSGYIMDYPSTIGGQELHAQLLWIFHQMNASDGLNQDCITAHKSSGDTEKCIFIPTGAAYVRTPMFPLQSQYDSWQVQNILRTENVNDINTFGQALENSFKETVTSKSQHGAFFDSCYHHCGEWDSIVIDGTRSGDAFKKWYQTGQGSYFQNQVYPCNTCCGN